MLFTLAGRQVAVTPHCTSSPPKLHSLVCAIEAKVRHCLLLIVGMRPVAYVITDANEGGPSIPPPPECSTPAHPSWLDQGLSACVGMNYATYFYYVLVCCLADVHAAPKGQPSCWWSCCSCGTPPTQPCAAQLHTDQTRQAAQQADSLSVITA